MPRGKMKFVFLVCITCNPVSAAVWVLQASGFLFVIKRCYHSVQHSIDFLVKPYTKCHNIEVEKYTV